MQMISPHCYLSLQWLHPACTSSCLWIDLQVHRNAVHCWGLGRSVLEIEKPENLQATPKRGCRDALHLPVLVTLKSASQCFRLAEQGLFILLYFCKRNGHIREKRKGYSQGGQDTVFASEGIYPAVQACSLSLLPVPQLLSSDSTSAPLGLLQWQAATSTYLLWFISSSLCSS